MKFEKLMGKKKKKEGKRGDTHLIGGQRGEGLDDSSQGDLRLLGHVGRTRHVVGRTADKPGTGISCNTEHLTVNHCKTKQ